MAAARDARRARRRGRRCSNPARCPADARGASASQGHELDNGQHILIGAYTELLPPDAHGRRARRRAAAHAARGALRRGLQPSLALAAGAARPAGGLLLARRDCRFAERLGAVRFMRALRRKRLPRRARHHGQAAARASTARTAASATTSGGRFACRRSTRRSTRPRPSVPRRAARHARRRRARRATCCCRASICRGCFPSRRREFVRRTAARCAAAPPVRDLASLQNEFAKVIVAVGPHQLKTLLPEACAEYHLPADLHLLPAVRGETRLPLPDARHGGRPGAMGVRPRRAARRKRPLACVISAQGDHQQMTQDELAETCHRELRSVVAELPAPRGAR